MVQSDLNGLDVGYRLKFAGDQVQRLNLAKPSLCPLIIVIPVVNLLHIDARADESYFSLQRSVTKSNIEVQASIQLLKKHE